MWLYKFNLPRNAPERSVGSTNSTPCVCNEFSSSIILRSHPYIKGGRRELKKGDVVGFEPQYLEKYDYEDKSYYLIKSYRALGIWEEN